MPTVKYNIELGDDERKKLMDIVKKGNAPAKTILKANILLASDRNGKKPMTVAEAAESYHTSRTTVQNIRVSYVERGLDATLTRKKRESPPVAPKVTGEVEARIIALACSEPPEGRSRWTVRLLADRIVELDIVPEMSYSTVHRTPKKKKFDPI